MRKKIRVYSIIAVLSAFTLMSFTASKGNTGDSGFYYCYIKGYYNGDTDNVGYVFSSVEEYNEKPQTSSNGWKAYAEDRESDFTASCSSYKLIGPFSFSHQAYKNQQDKVKSFKNSGYKVSEWNKGPRKN